MKNVRSDAVRHYIAMERSLLAEAHIGIESTMPPWVGLTDAVRGTNQRVYMRMKKVERTLAKSFASPPLEAIVTGSSMAPLPPGCAMRSEL